MFNKENPDHYPTPPSLIKKMMKKVDFKNVRYILEPSAGDGAIVDFIKKSYNRRSIISAIEIDQDLVNVLRGKEINVIDYDFLNFNGPDKFDLIIGNPPFSNGEYHLLKAIDIMYSGQIVFLLNAETLKNPYSNVRQMLVNKLTEVNAEIEYIPNAFNDAERSTNVEVALVYINIVRDIEEDLLSGATKSEINIKKTIDETGKEVSTKDSIKDIVAKYNRTVEVGTKTLINFYENYRYVGKYLSVVTKNTNPYQSGSLSEKLTDSLNEFLQEVRKSFWVKTLELDKVKNRMTEDEEKKFLHLVQKNHTMDFTENNIRTFILNLINSYDSILNNAVDHVFDFMTKHDYYPECSKNIYLFNGWKTNKSFYVNKKVILPFYSGVFNQYSGKLDYYDQNAKRLNDIDKVMNYFDGMEGYVSICDALNEASYGKKAESTYFTAVAYKKGTVHLTFKNDDVLRRFNVTACKNKHWLPDSYGKTSYDALGKEEQEVVNNFEGQKSYSKNCSNKSNLFNLPTNLIQITNKG